MITIDWVEFQHENTEEARMYNLNALGEGVAGLKCTHAGIYNDDDMCLYKLFYKTHSGVLGYLSSVERYENESANLFLRVSTKKISGIIRVRINP